VEETEDANVTLADKLTQPPKRERVVVDCVALIDAEVKAKGGFTGMAVKAAYSVVKAVKPRFVAEVVNGLLDDWVAKLESHWTDWEQGGDGKPFGEFLDGRRDPVADALLSVTDDRAQHAKSTTAKKMYQKMRPSAKKHVEEALPRLGQLVEKHANAAPEEQPPA
jgi:hypothetical protein